MTETRPSAALDRTTLGDRLPGLTGITEIEVCWPDQFGHALGKRIPIERLDAAIHSGVTFCDGALAWNAAGDVQDGVGFSNWTTGYPDAIAHPDLTTLRRLPWRPQSVQVLSDVTDRHGSPLAVSPRQVLRRVIAQLTERGYDARVGVELEFYLLDRDGNLPEQSVHCYSLEKLNAAEPALSTILEQLQTFTPVEAVNSEYGPSQFEVNIAHAPALEAADDAFRLRYALETLAARQGLTATFMAKPFTGLSGSSGHLHVSLWREGQAAFAPDGDREAPLAWHAVAGLLQHLPGITLYGAPTVNSYKRYEPGSFAPTSATWSGDNRTAALRSIVETPEATRLELRTPASDANPYWSIAATLAAVVAGIDAGIEPPARGSGNLYGLGQPLPTTLAEAVAAARADTTINELLGTEAAHDFAVLARSEWDAFTREVTTWERERYLRKI